MAEAKGITIQFRGDTTDFQKAVKSVNGELKQTKSEISLLNKQLKFDPKNVEALTKKFDLLQQKEKQLTELTKTLQDGMKNFDPNTKEWDNYNKQLQKAELELQAIRKELESTPTGKVQALAQGFDEWGKKLENVGGKLENIGKKLAVLSGGIVALGTAGVKFNAQLEQYQTAFTTLIGDADAAQKAIENIQFDASNSPFSTDSLIEANQYLISAGVEAEDARSTIMALGDAIAATGGGSAELSRMAQNLQQIKNLGKASSVDIKQFANAGINIYGLLAETTGKNVEQLKKMDITYEELNKALQVASGEGGRYFGAMEKQSKTLNGSISTLKDRFSQLLGELTQSLVPVIVKIIDFLNQLITKVREMSPEQQGMITRVAGLVAMLSPILTIGGKLITIIGGISSKIALLMKNERIVSIVAKLTANGSSLGAVLKTIFTFVKGLINPITIIIGILVTLYASNEQIRNQINAIFQSLVGLLEPAFQLIVNVLKIVWELIKKVVDVMKKMWEQFAQSEFAKKFIEIVQEMLEWIQKLIDWVTQLIGWLVDATNWFLNLIGAADSFEGASGEAKTKFDTGLNQYKSGGFGSNGFASGGALTLNANFTVNSNNIGRSDVKNWANWLADDINEALGRKIR